jgi:YHS domain-containing protein
MFSLFRILIIALVFYIVYLVVRFFQRLGSFQARPRTPNREIHGTMVKDEVCSTYLPREQAVRDVIDGKEQFFCSEECRRKFIEQKKKTA